MIDTLLSGISHNPFTYLYNNILYTSKYYSLINIYLKKFTMKRLYVLFFSLFLLSAGLNAQIAVTVTGGSNTTPALAASYPTLDAALIDLNLVTAMTGPVSFALSGTETAPPTGFTIGSATLSPVLSSTNTLTFTGPATINAGVGTATPTSAAPDGMLKLVGADHVTISNITLNDANAANPATMEYGIALFKRAAGDGCNNNTIQNCTINLQRINNVTGTTPMFEGSVGILVINSIPTAATTVLTPTNGGTLSTNGTNSGNKVYGNVITNVNYGVALSGFAATAGVGPAPNPTTFLGDLGNDIGGTSAATGNTVNNFGGIAAASTSSAGIRANQQWSVNLSFNTVNNNNGTGGNHVSTLRGIYAQAGTSANATINNNTVTIQSGAATSLCAAIENVIGSTAAANTVTINNNTINGAHNAATSGVFNGIINTATAATVNINGNMIQGIPSTFLAGTGTHVLIETGSPTTVTANGNTLQNFQRNGASGSWRGIKTTSPTNLTISNNTIDNLTYTLVTSTGGIDGIYSFSSAVNVTANNNIIKNLSTPTTGTINGIREFGVSGTKQFLNNQIFNLTTNAGGAGGGVFNGISLSTGTITVSANKVHDFTVGGAAGTAVGIVVSGGTSPLNINNNIVGNLNTTAATGLNAIRGIDITATITANVYFNTVYLNATSSSTTTFGSTCLMFSSSTTSLDLRNNILTNLSTPAQNGANLSANGISAALRRSAGTAATVPTNYATTSNNNAYYVNPTAGTLNHATYVEGTATITNLQNTVANLKAFMVNRDQASVEENPNFDSTTGSSPQFLHINPAIPTQLEGGAAPIAAITTDFDGNTRNSPPDIGADEFTGIPVDLNGPVISYSPLGFTCDGTVNRTLTASISDASGVPTSGVGLPVLYWRINAGAWTAATGTFVSGSNYSFSFGAGAVTNDIIQYYIVAQDLAAPNVSAFPSGGAGGFTANPPAAATPPSTPSSYQIKLALNGTYTVGAAGTYTTIKSAITAYNTSCLTGPVTFELIDAAYTTTADTILANPFASATNTLTIKPTVTSTITGNINGAVFLLSGADYVNIVGSITSRPNTVCPLERNNRDLTILNTNVGTSAALVWMATTSGGDPVTNCTIQDCILKGQANTTTIVGAGQGGPTIGSNAGANANSNNSFINNSLKKVANGIYSGGASAVLKNQSTKIILNEMNSAAPDNLLRTGIFVVFDNNTEVLGNNIGKITFTGSGDVIAIALGSGAILNSTSTGSEVTNAKIAYNKIDSIRQTGTFSACGIYFAPGTSGTSEISNNMISGVIANATSSDFTVGMFVTPAAGSTTNVYNNTVSMSGTITGGSEESYAFALNGGTDPIVNIKNNIFVNNQNTGSAKNYAIGFGYATFTNISSDYNDLFANQSSSLHFVGATTSISSPVDQLTITNWRTTTGKDANSKNANPEFVSASDPHLQVINTSNFNNLESMGTSIASIIDDIDCDVRSATPDIGADEYDGAVPSCIVPSSVAVGSITVNSANVSFTCSGCTGSYIVEYGPSGFVPGLGATAGGGTVVTGAASPIAISGLSAATLYNVYVRQDCGSGSYSPNSTMAAFTTLCSTFTLPYVQNFDGVTVPAVPNCTAVQNLNGATTWLTTTSINRSAPNCLTYPYDGTLPGDDWWYTPGFSLTGGTSYRLTFWYRAASVSYPEGLEIKYGTAQNAASMTSAAIFSNTNITNITYVQATVDFTPTTTGDYHIGFHSISAPDQFNLHIDDIGFDLAPACPSPSALAVNTVTATSANVTFTSGGTSFIVEYGAPGFTPGTGATAGTGGTIVTGTASPISLTSLTASTTYDVYARQECAGPIYSENSSKVTFTTQFDCASLPSLTCGIPVTTGNLAVAGSTMNVTACLFTTPGKEKIYTFTSTNAGVDTLKITNVNGGTGYIDYFYKIADGNCNTTTGWTCIEDLSTVTTDTFSVAAATTYYILADAESASSTANHEFRIACPPTCSTVVTATNTIEAATTCAIAGAGTVTFDPAVTLVTLASSLSIPAAETVTYVGGTGVTIQLNSDLNNITCAATGGIIFNNVTVRDLAAPTITNPVLVNNGSVQLINSHIVGTAATTEVKVTNNTGAVMSVDGNSSIKNQ